MSPFGTIYSYPNNPRVWKATIAAKIGGLEVVEDPDFKMGVTNKTPEFLAKFPIGKVPALETSDGFCVGESTAIAYYIAEAGNKADQLVGADVKSKALIRQWISFADMEVTTQATPLLLMFWGRSPYDEAVWNQKLPALDRSVKALEARLKGRKYLVGDDISLADIIVAITMLFGFKHLVDAKQREELPATVAWFNAVIENPAVKEVFPPVEFVEERKTPGQ